MVWNMTSDICDERQAVARYHGLYCFFRQLPGVSLRSTPGFMLPPAPQASLRLLQFRQRSQHLIAVAGWAYLDEHLGDLSVRIDDEGVTR